MLPSMAILITHITVITDQAAATVAVRVSRISDSDFIKHFTLSLLSIFQGYVLLFEPNFTLYRTCHE